MQDSLLYLTTLYCHTLISAILTVVNSHLAVYNIYLPLGNSFSNKKICGYKINFITAYFFDLCSTIIVILIIP